MHIYIYLTLISEEVIQRMGGTNIEENGERSSNTHTEEREGEVKKWMKQETARYLQNL